MRNVWRVERVLHLSVVLSVVIAATTATFFVGQFDARLSAQEDKTDGLPERVAQLEALQGMPARVPVFPKPK